VGPVKHIHEKVGPENSCRTKHFLDSRKKSTTVLFLVVNNNGRTKRSTGTSTSLRLVLVLE